MLSRWVGRLIIINTLIVFVRNCENYSVNKKITRGKNHASQKQVPKTFLEIAKFNKHSQGIQDLSTANETSSFAILCWLSGKVYKEYDIRSTAQLMQACKFTNPQQILYKQLVLVNIQCTLSIALKNWKKFASLSEIFYIYGQLHDGLPRLSAGQRAIEVFTSIEMVNYIVKMNLRAQENCKEFVSLSTFDLERKQSVFLSPNWWIGTCV